MANAYRDLRNFPVTLARLHAPWQISLTQMRGTELIDHNAELTLSSLAVAVASGQYVPGPATRRALADLAAAVARHDRESDAPPALAAL